jgi:hypothetical protein
MKQIADIVRRIQKRLIVSCQAFEGEAFRDCDCMARFAQAAVAGGAAGIRANGAEDISAIRKVVRVPIIGILKGLAADGGVLITGSFESAEELAAAGADIIALDCTASWVYPSWPTSPRWKKRSAQRPPALTSWHPRCGDTPRELSLSPNSNRLSSRNLPVPSVCL